MKIFAASAKTRMDGQVSCILGQEVISKVFEKTESTLSNRLEPVPNQRL